MAKKEETPKKAPEMMSDPKIEAVKQLIFGENMQQYDSEFNDIKALIKKSRTDIENELNETRESLNAMINDLRNDMNKKVTQLRTELDETSAELDDKKLNRKLLGALLQEMGKQISE